jgi:hypothetical protein
MHGAKAVRYQISNVCSAGEHGNHRLYKASTCLNLNEVLEHGLHLYPAPSGTQDLLHLVQDGNHHDALGTRRPIVTVQRYPFSYRPNRKKFRKRYCRCKRMSWCFLQRIHMGPCHLAPSESSLQAALATDRGLPARPAQELTVSRASGYANWLQQRHIRHIYLKSTAAALHSLKTQ